MIEPSPLKQTVRLSGFAIAEPIAAGRPKPIVFEGYWHLDSMANAGSRPLDVTLINDTLLSIDALEFKEPAKYKWSHKDGVINAPWIWSAPIQYVNYSVVSVDNAKAVLKKETDGMLLYFTHILEVPEGE